MIKKVSSIKKETYRRIWSKAKTITSKTTVQCWVQPRKQEEVEKKPKAVIMSVKWIISARVSVKEIDGCGYSCRTIVKGQNFTHA